jgi:hypothetical protein
LLFPLRWTGSQLLALLPALALLTITVRANWWRIDNGDESFAKRYVAVLALGPFAVTTAIAALLGRLPIAMWGYPLWCFVPLAAVMWLAASHGADRLRRFATVSALMFAGWIAIYAADELLEPMLRDRAKATNFPGRAVAEAITRAWRDKTGTPLVYVAQVERSSPGAGEFAANNVAVYSPDRPHVIVHGDPALSPWVDAVDLKGRGAAIVWEQAPGAPDLPAAVRARFPTAEVQPLLALPRLVSRTGTTATVGYAFVLPKP